MDDSGNPANRTFARQPRSSSPRLSAYLGRRAGRAYLGEDWGLFALLQPEDCEDQV